MIVLDEAVRVTRARATFGTSPTLRIFGRPQQRPLKDASTPLTSSSSSSRAGTPTMMAGRRKPAGKKLAKKSKKEGGQVDATLAASIYYGFYALFFGKLLLVLLERFMG